MESSLPSGYGQVFRVFRQGFSAWLERSTDDTGSNWTTRRYNLEEMKGRQIRGRRRLPIINPIRRACRFTEPRDSGRCMFGDHNFSAAAAHKRCPEAVRKRNLIWSQRRAEGEFFAIFC